MANESTLILESGYAEGKKKIPPVCKRHHLDFRFALDFPSEELLSQNAFTFVKRLLKLFPFEKLKIEVEAGRVRDVFGDWDSYLEWCQAEPWAKERLFRRIEVWRISKCLGFFQWKADINENQLRLEIYTEADQSGPFQETCLQVAKEARLLIEKRTFSPQTQGPRFYDWALSFLNSSVRRGTTSKRSATKP